MNLSEGVTRRAAAWVEAASSRWPHTLDALRLPCSRWSTGLMLIPTLRAGVIARTLLELEDIARDVEDPQLASFIRAYIPHGHLDAERLSAHGEGDLSYDERPRLWWTARGMIDVGAVRVTTPIRLTKTSGLSDIDALECRVVAAPPFSPHAHILAPDRRPYFVLDQVDRDTKTVQMVRCDFTYRKLSPEEWEECRGSEATRPQTMIDRQSAARIVRALGGDAASPQDVEGLARVLKRFTQRGTRSVYLVPQLGAQLERVCARWISQEETSDEMNAIVTRVCRELGAAEEALLRLWRAPRPVLERAYVGNSTSTERPFAVACFGDNADVLRALYPSLEGRVAAVYIDPPYDTGTTEFRYDDRYGADRWLRMMDLRLRELRALMSPSSSIHMSINESRVFELKLLGDQTFGASHYLGMTTVRVRHDDRILKGHKALHEVTDFLLGFRASEAHQPGQRPAVDKSAEYCWRLEVDGEPIERSVRGGKEVERYDPARVRLVKCVGDEGGDGTLKRINIRGALRESNSSGRFFTKHLQDELTRHPGALFRVRGMGGDGLGYRDFVMPPAESGRRNPDYLQGPPLQGSRRAGRPFSNLVDFERSFNQVHREGGVEFRNGKKPVEFLHHVLTLQGVPSIRDAIVMDCFAGSGSLASAVEILDQADDGRRCCVLVESGPWYADVLLERLSRHMEEAPTAAARGYVRVRFALFEDVLDHMVWEEDLDAARSQEGGGPLAALRRDAAGAYRWIDPGMATVDHVILARAISGLTVERCPLERDASLALWRGQAPMTWAVSRAAEGAHAPGEDELGGASTVDEFYAVLRGERIEG